MEISWSMKTVAGSSCLKISKTITLTSNPSWNFTVGVTLATRVKTKEKTEVHFSQDVFLSSLRHHVYVWYENFLTKRSGIVQELKFFIGAWSPTSKRFWVASALIAVIARLSVQIAIVRVLLVRHALALDEWEKQTDLIAIEKRNKIWWGHVRMYLIKVTLHILPSPRQI